MECACSSSLQHRACANVVHLVTLVTPSMRLTPGAYMRTVARAVACGAGFVSSGSRSTFAALDGELASPATRPSCRLAAGFEKIFIEGAGGRRWSESAKRVSAT
jgi:hypothetical protein